MPDFPNVNGVETSYCSIRLMIGPGVPIVGVVNINYKDVGNIPKVKGASSTPIGRTTGENDAEGDLEILQSEWDELLPRLTLNGTIGYMQTTWPVAITYAELIQPTKTKTDILSAVRFHSAERSNAQGAEANTVKLQMSIMGIKWHGLYEALRQIT